MANWSDLGSRVASAVVMMAVGAVAVWLGGPVFMALVLIAVAAMAWEIFTICELEPATTRQVMPVVFAGLLGLTLYLGDPAQIALASLALAIGFGWRLQREKLIGGAILFAIFWVGVGLVWFRESQGIAFILWLLLVVIASDVMGYFAGKSIGGPKFWPSISPKKTWSGTVAGWVGAGLVGLGFVIWNGSPTMLIPLSVLASFAGQMGDIAESALKRRTGVKDSSNLIPGHGGVLDRFDAVSGAVLFVLVISAFFPFTV